MLIALVCLLYIVRYSKKLITVYLIYLNRINNQKWVRLVLKDVKIMKTVYFTNVNKNQHTYVIQ